MAKRAKKGIVFDVRLHRYNLIGRIEAKLVEMIGFYRYLAWGFIHFWGFPASKGIFVIKSKRRKTVIEGATGEKLDAKKCRIDASAIGDAAS